MVGKKSGTRPLVTVSAFVCFLLFLLFASALMVKDVQSIQ